MKNLKNTMKAAARRALAVMARPIWRRIWARIEARIDTRIATQTSNYTTETSNCSAAWHQHLPALLNVAASVGAIARQQERMNRELQSLIASGHEQERMNRELQSLIASGHEQDGQPRVSEQLNQLWDATDRVTKAQAEIWSRIEFVRSELLYEVRYGARQVLPGREVALGAPARIVNEAKVRAAGAAGIRLNLGCGHVPLDGYVNVDMRDLPGVDVVARADALPFQRGEVSEIYSSHVLEHFTSDELERNLLPYWVSLLEPGGSFRAVVPDGEAMIRSAAEGTYPFNQFREVFFGGQDYDGDFHFNMFTAATLADSLRRAGLEDIQVLAQGRRNGDAFELEIAARAART